MGTILVLGGEGMLGHKLFQCLAQQFEGTRCTLAGELTTPFLARTGLFNVANALERMDAMEFDSFAARIRELKPAFLVNCIGIVKQRDTARLAIPSITLNSLLPHRLASLAGEWGGRVIHFSTDCVFSGKKGHYTEDDPSDAEDLYGKTKFLGEVAGANALTLRTSIIGRELANFASLLEWFLAQRGKRIVGFKRVIYAGVTTNYMAEVVGRIIKEKPELSGLFQVTSEPISKYDLLCRLKQAYGLQVEIEEEHETVCDRSMLGDRFARATGYSIPTWDYLVEQLAGDTTPYDSWRQEGR